MCSCMYETSHFKGGCMYCKGPSLLLAVIIELARFPLAEFHRIGLKKISSVAE